MRAALLHLRPAAPAVVSHLRLALILAGSVLALSFATLAVPEAEARWLYCTSARGSCSGVACHDSNLNGRYDPDDSCLQFACPHGCCYGAPCPPPQE